MEVKSARDIGQPLGPHQTLHHHFNLALSWLHAHLEKSSTSASTHHWQCFLRQGGGVWRSFFVQASPHHGSVERLGILDSPLALTKRFIAVFTLALSWCPCTPRDIGQPLGPHQTLHCRFYSSSVVVPMHA